MSVLGKIKNLFLGLGAVFASLLLSLSVLSTPVFADPTTNTDQTQSQTTQDASSSDKTVTTDTCYDESGSLGWLVCPTTGFLAKITDGLYETIEDFLVVEPLTSEADNPYHQVWAICRDITNIIFVIFFLIIIFSQLTGVGISNYGIKRALPKLVVSAILINLSYIICALLVDVSNVIGASLRGLFTSIESGVTATGILASAGATASSVSYSSIVAALAGGTLLAGVAIGAAGGLGYVFISLLPVLLSAVVAVAIAFVTLAARQALVYLLIMISPLAFVCLLLPNTEKWFDQWKKTLTQMLFFYPMFAALFGACSLVSWVMIAAAEKPIMLVFGIAIKVVPLIASWSMLKMSGTIPGQIGNALRGFASKPLGAAKKASAERAALRRAEYTAKQLQRPFNPASGGSWRARTLQGQYSREARLRSAQARTQGLLEETRMAELEGKKIVGRNSAGAPIYAQELAGYDSDGNAIYRDRVKETKALRDEQMTRQIGLRNSASKLRVDNVMSTMGTYLEENNVEASASLAASVSQQATNFNELMTQASAKRRNDLADKRWYANQVAAAGKRTVTGELVDRDAYDRLIRRGAGADAFVSSSLTGEALREAETARTAALASVEADAIDALEAERKAITAKYTTYMGKQVTKEVLKIYEQMLDAKDIEGICAAQNTLAMRGDYDKIVEHLQAKMDEEGYVELGTDFANVLALNLLGMKDADPELARLGKHINVETWAYTDGSRKSNTVTYKEFMTGKTNYIDPTTGLAEKTKYFAETLLRGTGVKGIDRTFYGGLKSSMDRYFTAENYGSEAEAEEARVRLMTEMLPQIISALPTFAAGSEQITNTLNFLTGMSCGADGKWTIKKPAEDAKHRETYKLMTERYLRGLTSNDLIALKTDTFNALKARFLDLYGSEAAAQAKFREFTEKQVKNLRAGDPSALAPMKQSVREYLGL